MYFFCEKSKLWFLNSLTIKKDKTHMHLVFLRGSWQTRTAVRGFADR